MIWSEFSCSSLWWLLPPAMMALCFMLMRGRKGPMMCGFDSYDEPNHRKNDPDSPMDILARRYARGEIDRQEYTKRKNILSGTSD